MTALNTSDAADERRVWRIRLRCIRLDARRLARFARKHAEIAGRLPNKELASYLNLTPETLSRLKARLHPE